MTLLQKLPLVAILSSTTFSLATDLSKTILPDNVIRCEPDAGCVSKTINGRTYKVITTPRFTVMVAISHEGIYTRADVSIANKTDTPLSMTPDDFRVEVLTPKPRVLLYVPPANLVLPPETPSQPPAPAAATAANATPALPISDIDLASAASKEKNSQDAAGKAATNHNLSASFIAPNEATSGRVYFERDKHANLVNVVLPIAGVVFEFPYAMKK
jgi:hypothetical protein